MQRRAYLSLLAASSIPLAGCTSSDPDEESPEPEPEDEPSEESDTDGSEEDEEPTEQPAPAPDGDGEGGAQEDETGEEPDSGEDGQGGENRDTTLPSLRDVEPQYYDGGATAFEGSGQHVTDSFQGELGPIVLDYEHSGSGNFIVEVWNEDRDERAAIPINEIGSVDGVVAVPAPIAEYSLDVDADGSWSINAAHPFPDPEIDAHTTPAHASGEGPSVVGPIDLDGSVTVYGEHSGESNFIVTLLNEDAESAFDGRSAVFNDIGQFEGETRVEHTGLAFVVVEADGAWRVELGGQ